MTEEKKINPETILATCTALKEAYPYLTFITAIDYPAKNIIEIVYHLQSLTENTALLLKAELPRKNGALSSVCSVWPAAEWHEREVFDLFGINFINHPNLQRILLTADWEGHPLLKDYSKSDMKKRPETIK